MEHKLCLIKGSFAFFTTQGLANQSGDFWFDRPYSQNVGDPYAYAELDNESGKPEWSIIKAAWDGGLTTPGNALGRGGYSVHEINAGAVPWLQQLDWSKEMVSIMAGVTIGEFCELIEKAGGMVYFPRR